MKNEKGYAILIVLLAVILISVIGFGLLTVSSQSIQTSTNEKVDQSLFFVAEAGLNYADEDIQKQIVVAYEDLKKNPPANFNVEFKSKVQTILNQYAVTNKGTKAPSSLLKASDNKKPEIWVGDVNPNPTDTSKLITFKIYSEGKDVNSAKSRKVEREVSIPSELHLVVGNIVSEEDYSQTDDDEFLADIDKEEEDKASKESEENIDDPEDIPEIPSDENTKNIYVKNNSDIYLTRHYNLNTKFFVKEKNTSNKYKINLFSRNYRIPFTLTYVDYVRSKNSTYIWNKFLYEQETNKHAKSPDKVSLPLIPSYKDITLATGTEKNLITNVSWPSNNTVYRMPELNKGILTHLLNNSKNYIFNIDIGNKDRVIIFNKSILNYDLSNIAFNVKGTGKLDIIIKEDFIISPNRKFIVKNQNPNSKVKINLIAEKKLAVMGTLEVDGDVTASRNIKFYYEPSTITGNLHLEPSSILLVPSSNLTVYTNAKLDVANIYTHSTIRNPAVRIFGTLNMDSVYTHDFESHLLAKINKTSRKKTIPNEINFDEYVSHKFLPTSELIKATPIIEIK